ncbi:MAG: PSD1 and planctomycete cytochrome C domain-containing protein [Pirellulales bacterium]
MLVMFGRPVARRLLDASAGCLLAWGLFCLPALGDGGFTFESDIRPILKVHCFHCHGDDGTEPKANLDLRLRRLMAQGGDSGPAIADTAANSLLWQRISQDEMPPGEKKLSAEEKSKIEQWLAGGAPTARPEPDTVPSGADLTPEERAFWSFQPVTRPAVPGVRMAESVRTPVDAFVQSKLEQQGLALSPEAERVTLIRRATFDLWGLPPTPQETDQFLADTSPDAYERLLDRLLESPRYGERWGRHWLDVAGYADSDGYTPDDIVRKYSYKYRDYVIRSFNADKPLDQFIQEQLAGDEMVAPPYFNLEEADLDKLVATGFLRMGPDGTNGGPDQELARNQVMAETIKIVSTSLLGLSVGCAQCHSHKYDPIPQTDYYRLRAIFEPAYDVSHWRSPAARLVSLYTDANREQAAAVEAEAAKVDALRNEKQAAHIARVFEQEIAKLSEELREPVRAARDTPQDKRTPEQARLLREHPSVLVDAGSLYLYDPAAAKELKELSEQAAALRGTKPVEEFVRALTEVPGAQPQTFLFARGNHTQPKQPLPPGELSVLVSPQENADLPPDDPAIPTSGRRLAYARRLTSGQHPLLARVLANRVWLHHFGRGLVSTPTDFGLQGERPTHPELLDWLASELVAGGWKLKSFHRLLMASTVYRQASYRTPALEAADPDNLLLGRMAIRRLEAEAVRDAMIAVSGKLNEKMYGPAVPVIEDEDGQFVLGIENLNGENRPGPVLPLHGEEFRRSIYVQMRRTRPLAVLDTFDEPTMDPNCALRSASTVTPQALMLMNNDFVLAQAAHMAQRVASESGSDPAAQVARAWRLAFCRLPGEVQQASAVEFVRRQTDLFRAAAASQPAAGTNAPVPIEPEVQALTLFCQALLSANEFLYVD